MNDMIEDATRKQVMSFLPAAITRALESYHDFFDNHRPENDPKKFAAHHSACKIAIAHVELLLKLGRWAQVDESEPTDELSAMLSHAEDEVRRYYDEGQAE